MPDPTTGPGPVAQPAPKPGPDPTPTTDTASSAPAVHPDTARADRLQRQLDESDRERTIDRLLTDAGASDPESARLLLHDALVQSPQDDPSRLVEQIKQRKPHLFAPAGPAPSGTMAPVAEPEPDALMRAAADSARRDGNMRALLVYMRHRRNAR